MIELLFINDLFLSKFLQIINAADVVHDAVPNVFKARRRGQASLKISPGPGKGHIDEMRLPDVDEMGHFMPVHAKDAAVFVTDHSLALAEQDERFVHGPSAAACAEQRPEDDVAFLHELGRDDHGQRPLDLKYMKNKIHPICPYNVSRVSFSN